MTATTSPIKARARKAPATTKKAPAKKVAAKPEPTSEWHAARARAAAERAANGETVKERRNETRHPDGAAAVAAYACPRRSAKKGDQCFKADGADRTPYVHAPRFAKWEAATAKKAGAAKR